MNPTPPPPPPPAGGPSTREIPVVPPSGATTTARMTGPVGYVPGPPAAGPAAPPPAAPSTVPQPPRDGAVDLSDRPRARRPRAGLRAAALLLGVVAAAVLEIGLLVHGGVESLWSRTPLWSAFASAAAVVGLAGVAARLAGGRPAARPVALGGCGGLAVFWLLVALPSADTDRGFLLTAALALLAAAVWASGRAEEPPAA